MDLIPNLSLRAIAYLSIHLFRSGHIIPQNPTKSAQQFPCRTEVNCRPRTLLPNSSEETFLLPDGFLTELDPQVRLLTLPNFGVNICPFNYGIKVFFIPELTPATNVFKLNLFNTYSLPSQSVGVFAWIQTLDHLFLSSNPQWQVKIKLLR
jgi:hypothetical protein